MLNTDVAQPTAIWPDPSACAGRSPYHLTAEQIQSFDEHGFIVLRRWIPRDLLHRVQDAATAWIRDGWSFAANDPRRQDIRFADRAGEPVMFKVNYVHDKRQAAPEFKVQPGDDEEQELRIAHEAHTAGSFCSAGNAG